MGNCICTTSQQDQECSEIVVRRVESKRAKPNKVDEELEDGGIEKRVEFEPKEGEKRVRIKVVLTQQELKQILEFHNGNISNYTSMEELLRSVRRRSPSKRSSKGCRKSDGNNKGWTPALHTIPEDI